MYIHRHNDMSQTPHTVIVFKLLATLLSTSCVVFRFFVIRNNFPRNLRTTICHIFLFIACIFDITADALAVWSLSHEIHDPSPFDTGLLNQNDHKVITRPCNVRAEPALLIH